MDSFCKKQENNHFLKNYLQIKLKKKFLFDYKIGSDETLKPDPNQGILTNPNSKTISKPDLNPKKKSKPEGFDLLKS